MPRFAINNPYLIVVIALLVGILGVVSVGQMPVDMFPAVNIPVVSVATFYSGMPPQQIETNLTYHMERQFTLAGGIEHIESRSLPGVSLIKVYFQPGTDPDAAAANISSLAMTDLRDMPPGTYPPIVLKSDASSLPVCLVTLNGEGLNESTLKDLAQNFVRNQLAGVPGASVTQPFGGRWRQIMLYVDPQKLEGNQLSPMDVVRAVNESNVMLPAGDVQIGRYDYNIYTNSMLKGAGRHRTSAAEDRGPVAGARRRCGGPERLVRPCNTTSCAWTGSAPSICRSSSRAADSNTIAIVDGVQRKAEESLDVPASLESTVVFDQSRFVKTAIETLLHEGGIGLFLTCLMILIFLGSMRATVAVFFSIPLSVAGDVFCVEAHWQFDQQHGAGRIGAGVVAPDRQFGSGAGKHFPPSGERRSCRLSPRKKVVRKWRLPVLAGTLTTVVVFFPVTLLYGVSKFLFSASGAGGGDFAVRFILRRADGGSSLLRPLHQSLPHVDT